MEVQAYVTAATYGVLYPVWWFALFAPSWALLRARGPHAVAALTGTLVCLAVWAGALALHGARYG